ncbi:hypothetical protein ACWEAF_27850 [Streptomyces sp. NPDC005071]
MSRRWPRRGPWPSGTARISPATPVAPPGHGRHERFVTQRCRAVGRPEARARLDALLGGLACAGLEVVEVEEEFVVHDDHPAVDAGWIDERTEQPVEERGERRPEVTV